MHLEIWFPWIFGLSCCAREQKHDGGTTGHAKKGEAAAEPEI
jgi:hypothetical protein